MAQISIISRNHPMESGYPLTVLFLHIQGNPVISQIEFTLLKLIVVIFSWKCYIFISMLGVQWSTTFKITTISWCQRPVNCMHVIVPKLVCSIGTLSVINQSCLAVAADHVITTPPPPIMNVIIWYTKLLTWSTKPIVFISP